jgi:DNA-binding MarR family transcriptional regulator
VEESGVAKHADQEIGPLIQRLARAARHLEYALGLNPAQWDALRYLARANAMSRTPGALAEFLATTKGTASQTVMALAAKGLITRVRTEGDRRVVHLDLTDQGTALIAQDPLVRLDHAAESLPGEMAEPLAAALRRVLTALGDSAHEFGVCRNCGHHVRTEGASRCALTALTQAITEPEKICVNFERPDPAATVPAR